MVGQPDPASQLSELVHSEAQNELACRAFLPQIAKHLCHHTINRVQRISSEEPTRFGLSDFVISAEVSHGGLSEVIGYVWEIKAAQLFLYELDVNSRRFRPTIDLIRAETQLLHYVSDAQDSKAFKEYFGLGVTSKVLPAGIIIGRRDRIAKVTGSPGQEPSLDQETLAKHSDYIRRTILYEPAQIWVKTWDWVIDTLRAPAKISLP